MHVLQLPTDIFIIIFSYLDRKDLVVCKRVCRSFRSLFKASAQLSLELALARAGLVDGVLERPVADRLKLLRQLEENWYPQDLKPRRQLKIRYQSPCTQADVSSGFVVSGIISRNSQYFEELQVYRLPSYLSPIKAKLWKHQLVETHIQSFKADPVQDLLVLLETPEAGPVDYDDHRDMVMRIHLRTFSTNKPHSAAALPFLRLYRSHLGDHANQLQHTPHDLKIRLYLDVLAVLAQFDGFDSEGSTTRQEALIIWQWTSGRLLATLFSSSELEFSDFTFINRDELLITHHHSPHGPTLSVVHLISEKSYPTPTNPSITPAKHYSQQAIFQLPELPFCAHQCLDIPYIKVINDPEAYPRHSSSAHNNPMPLFAPDSSDESAMIALSIPIVLRTPQRGPAPTIHHTLLVRVSTLRSFYSSAPQQPAEPVAFDQWSARGVHWVSGPPGFLHGQRYAYTTLDQGRTNVEIHDFNPYHIPAPVSGWQALVTISNQSPSPTIIPKTSNFKVKSSTGCTHKHYFECGKLISNMRYKKQTMKASFGEEESSCALDYERVIVLDTERGGYIFGFTSYNV
ncbi:hypothetical protein FRC07_006172 [Ceratobasidium sp. 392]|nr:hypothetical protein FRC07_006172 [Ceratobasidium sp. 392]